MDDIIKCAVVAAFTALAVNAAAAENNTTSHQETPMEKCYGIAKAGMNDCQTSHGACASSAEKDAEPDAFILLPQGICDRIVGGKKQPNNTK